MTYQEMTEYRVGSLFLSWLEGDYCKLDEAAKPDDPVPAPTPDFDEDE